MRTRPTPDGCVEPRFEPWITPYCFGDVTDAQRDAFEEHLLACEYCWQAVDELAAKLRAVKGTRSLAATLLTPDVMGVLGMSGGLLLPFAGHQAHAWTVSLLSGLLFGVPVLVEVAYEFPRHGTTALMAAPLMFVAMTGVLLAALHQIVTAARKGHNGLYRALALLAGATVAVCAALLPFLPVEATVAASFGTYPTRLGYLKSVAYAWAVILPFVVWPFHFVVTMQWQLTRGRYAEVLAILSRAWNGVPPRGTLYPQVWMLLAGLALLIGFNYVGVNHLFEALKPSDYQQLFMSLVLLRVTIWLGLAGYCVVWYGSALRELRRESLTVLSFTPDKSGR